MIDPTTLIELVTNLNVSDSGSLASLFSAFQGIQQWRANRRYRNKRDDLDAYIDSLRRQEHEQVVNFIMENRDAFQRLFDEMESAVVAAIEKLDQQQQRRHEEVMDNRVLAERITIRQIDGFTAEVVQNTPEWQASRLQAAFTLVNKNRSNLTIESARM